MRYYKTPEFISFKGCAMPDRIERNGVVQRHPEIIAAEATRISSWSALRNGSYYAVSDVARAIWRRLTPQEGSD